MVFCVIYLSLVICAADGETLRLGTETPNLSEIYRFVVSLYGYLYIFLIEYLEIDIYFFLEEQFDRYKDASKYIFLAIIASLRSLKFKMSRIPDIKL